MYYSLFSVKKKKNYWSAYSPVKPPTIGWEHKIADIGSLILTRNARCLESDSYVPYRINA